MCVMVLPDTYTETSNLLRAHFVSLCLCWLLPSAVRNTGQLRAIEGSCPECGH